MWSKYIFSNLFIIFLNDKFSKIIPLNISNLYSVICATLFKNKCSFANIKSWNKFSQHNEKFSNSILLSLIISRNFIYFWFLHISIFSTFVNVFTFRKLSNLQQNTICEKNFRETFLLLGEKQFTYLNNFSFNDYYYLEITRKTKGNY